MPDFRNDQTAGACSAGIRTTQAAGVMRMFRSARRDSARSVIWRLLSSRLGKSKAAGRIQSSRRCEQYPNFDSDEEDL
jgi:hypothetical protein